MHPGAYIGGYLCKEAQGGRWGQKRYAKDSETKSNWIIPPPAQLPESSDTKAREANEARVQWYRSGQWLKDKASGEKNWRRWLAGLRQHAPSLPGMYTEESKRRRSLRGRKLKALQHKEQFTHKLEPNPRKGEHPDWLSTLIKNIGKEK